MHLHPCTSFVFLRFDKMLAYVSSKELKWLGVGTADEQRRLMKIVKHARRRGVEIHVETVALPSL